MMGAGENKRGRERRDKENESDKKRERRVNKGQDRSRIPV
jgi:hypothetical protein